MKYIISGTNRKNSHTLQVSIIIQELYKEAGEAVEIIDLAELPFESLLTADYDAKNLNEKIKRTIDKINTSEGLIFVVPEYNGSYPGILKLFIDYWSYPLSFEHRPMCFVGLGWRFAGLRPVEHLQQVMGYRNAFQFPDRVFLMNIGKTMQDKKLQDHTAMQLLRDQVKGFRAYCATQPPSTTKL